MGKSFTIKFIPMCSYSYLNKIYYKLEKLKYIRRYLGFWECLHFKFHLIHFKQEVLYSYKLSLALVLCKWLWALSV